LYIIAGNNAGGGQSDSGYAGGEQQRASMYGQSIELNGVNNIRRTGNMVMERTERIFKFIPESNDSEYNPGSRRNLYRYCNSDNGCMSVTGRNYSSNDKTNTQYYRRCCCESNLMRNIKWLDHFIRTCSIINIYR
jgi:hypothetical protein